MTADAAKLRRRRAFITAAIAAKSLTAAATLRCDRRTADHARRSIPVAVIALRRGVVVVDIEHLLLLLGVGGARGMCAPTVFGGFINAGDRPTLRAPQVRRLNAAVSSTAIRPGPRAGASSLLGGLSCTTPGCGSFNADQLAPAAVHLRRTEAQRLQIVKMGAADRCRVQNSLMLNASFVAGGSRGRCSRVLI